MIHYEGPVKEHLKKLQNNEISFGKFVELLNQDVEQSFDVVFLNKKEAKLAQRMLEEAKDQFSNHGCNDVAEEFWDEWSTEERQKFVKEYHEYNGDVNEFNPNFLNLPDFAIMGFLGYKLTKK